MVRSTSHSIQFIEKIKEIHTLKKQGGKTDNCAVDKNETETKKQTEKIYLRFSHGCSL